MRHAAVLIACLLSVVSGAFAATVLQSGWIQYNNQIIQSNGDGNQLTMTSSPGVCQNTQLWSYDSDGYIYRQDNKTLVMDVQNSNTNNGNPIIMWYKKVPGPGVNTANQLWNVNSSGIFTRLNPPFAVRKSSTSNNVVNSNNMPVQPFQFVQPQYPCPVTCQSHGDPHFTTWSLQHYNFQSAYSTVLLANWSWAKVYTVQFPCNTGVTCNEGFVVQPTGTNSTFQCTFEQAFFNGSMISLPIGTTVFNAFINVTKWSNTFYTINIQGGFINYGVYSWYRGLYTNVDVTINNGYPGPSLCMGPTAGQDPHAFGLQYLVSAQNQTAYVYTQAPFSYNPNYVPNYGPYTTNDPTLIANTTAACSVLTQTNGPLAPCMSLVDPTFYNGTCYNDSYATGDVSFARGSIDAYIRQCIDAAGRNGTNVTLPTSPATTVIVNITTTVSVSSTASFTIISRDLTAKNRTTGGDNYTVTATGPGTITSFTVTDNGDGTYYVTFTATVEGTYTVSVQLNGIDQVSNSPFNVTFTAVTSATTTSLVYGPIHVNQTLTITLVARTASGSMRTTGGDSFNVTFTGGNVVSVTDNGNGTYYVTITATTIGYQMLYVTFNGNQIMCSPYTVIVVA